VGLKLTTKIIVVFLHGGPGGGVSASDRKYFNPEKYNVGEF
jgi:proline iminopeptidase